MAEIHDRPTIEDVAREAGVSVTTASYVLSKSKYVEEIAVRTRQRVLAAAEKLGYSRNVTAAALQRGYGNTVVLLIDKWEVAEAHARAIAAISQAAADRGLETVYRVAPTGQDTGTFLRNCLSLNPFGLLLLWDAEVVGSEELAELHSRGLPVVDLIPSSPEGIVCVTADRAEATAKCVQYLMELGHRRIGIILHSAAKSRTNREMLVGYKRALRSAGIEFDDSLVVDTGTVDFDAGHEGFEMLFNRRPDITGVICMNDLGSLGAVRAAQDMGVNIPAEVSVVGAGAYREGTYFRPSITTVELPHNKIARTAIDIIIGIREGRAHNPEPIYEPMPLIVRESTAPARNGSSS
ncbi:MAG: LacI family DNA-binding transcriptional regulator [Armatimonadetes bacterium]|nr:LacI family DNA-binding transcriptional regulator [Armatimonadota bacterium]